MKNLKPRAREILRRLSQENYASQIAHSLNISKGTVSYWTKKFEEQGLIKCDVNYPFKKYIITEAGSKILTGSEVRSLCRVEDYPVKFGVVEWEKVPIDWKKLGNPRNWVKMGFRLDGVMVEKTSKNVIVHSGQMAGNSPFELAYYAGRVCDDVARTLVERFGMKLCVGEPLRKPIIRFYDPIYEELAKRAAVSVDGIGSIDASPPTLKGHLEYPVDLAAEFITAPVRLKQVEKRLDDDIKKIRQELTFLSQGQATNDQQTKSLIDCVILMTACVKELVDELRFFFHQPINMEKLRICD